MHLENFLYRSAKLGESGESFAKLSPLQLDCDQVFVAFRLGGLCKTEKCLPQLELDPVYL